MWPRSHAIKHQLCGLVAERILADPSLLEAALAHVESGQYRSDYADVWRDLLLAGADAVVGVLTSTSDVAAPLKSDHPFATLGVVSEEERLAIVEQAYKNSGSSLS